MENNISSTIPSPIVSENDIALANTEIKENPHIKDTSWEEDLRAQMDNFELE